MSKAILYAEAVRAGSNLHEQLLEGVEQIALAVGSTLGPRGRNVIIDRPHDVPKVTKDGVTVAESIALSDTVHNAAAKMVRAVARATVLEAGDGTTTATVLAHQILSLGLGAVRSGTNPIALQRAIGFLVSGISQQLQGMALPMTPERVEQVARISTNGNEFVAKLIAEAFSHVGAEGTITLDDSKNGQTHLEIRKGFQISSGFVSPDFITDPNRGVAVLEDPLIFITERQLSQGVSIPPRLHDLGPLLTYCAGGDAAGKTYVRDPRPLLIVCDDLLAGSDAFQTLIANHRLKMQNHGGVQICVVRAAGFGEHKRAGLSDLAMATGGQVMKQDGGEALYKWLTDEKGGQSGFRLGRCRRAVISNSRTILEDCAGDPGDPEVIGRFAASLREQAEDAEPMAREYLLQRASRLTGTVAVVHVGAPTEEEAAALRDSVEDAILAVRSAIREGVLPGGGLALFTIAQQLAANVDSLHPDLTQAGKILTLALCAPLEQIAMNAGDNPVTVCAKVIAANPIDRTGGPIGYDATTGEYVDLLEKGIVDPAKVVRVALEKAASIAALMMTSSCMIYEDPESVKGQTVVQLPAIPGPQFQQR